MTKRVHDCLSCDGKTRHADQRCSICRSYDRMHEIEDSERFDD